MKKRHEPYPVKLYQIVEERYLREIEERRKLMRLTFTKPDPYRY